MIAIVAKGIMKYTFYIYVYLECLQNCNVLTGHGVCMCLVKQNAVAGVN